MKIVSMKYTSKEQKEEAVEEASLDSPTYPWGLQLSLNDECLQKLGVEDLAELPVGTIVQISGIGKVTGTREAQYEGGEPEICLDVQLTDLGMEKTKGKKSIGAALYGEKV